MVLPAPSADDAPREGAWIRAIQRELSLTATGLLLLVDHARPERLRDLVLALLPATPDLEVYTDVEAAYRVPEGSVMILAPHADDADWLNLQRPVFARRQLKVILWCDAETTAALATKAVDFFDWISHRHECPEGASLHGALGIRSALCARAVGIVWTGGDLEACFRAALPGREMARLSANLPFPMLVQAVRGAGRAWIVCDDAGSWVRALLLEQALAEAGRRSRVIVIGRHDQNLLDWPELSGICAPLGDAREALADAGASQPGRLAALAALDPHLIALLAALLRDGKDEQALDRVMRGAQDPGAAAARWIEREAPAELNDHALWRDLPMFVRAFGGKRTSATLRARARLESLRRDPKKLATEILSRAEPIGSDLAVWAMLAREAVELTSQVPGPMSVEHAEALRILAEIDIRRGRFSEAAKALRAALAIHEKSTGAPRSLLQVLLALTDVLTRQGRYAEAQEVAMRAVETAKAARGDPLAGDPLLQEAERRLQQVRMLG